MSENEDKDHIAGLQRLVAVKEVYIKELLASLAEEREKRIADLLHRLGRESEAREEERRDSAALVQELQARLTAKEQELEDSCALIKRQGEKLTAYETTIRELRRSLDKPERHMEVDPEKKLEEEEEKRKKNIQRLMDERMNSTKTEYASRQLEAMTVGFTKIVNGKSVTRWSVNRWEVGTFGKNDAMNLTETLVELGFDVE